MIQWRMFRFPKKEITEISEISTLTKLSQQGSKINLEPSEISEITITDITEISEQLNISARDALCFCFAFTFGKRDTLCLCFTLSERAQQCSKTNLETLEISNQRNIQNTHIWNFRNFHFWKSEHCFKNRHKPDSVGKSNQTRPIPPPQRMFGMYFIVINKLILNNFVKNSRTDYLNKSELFFIILLLWMNHFSLSKLNITFVCR